MQSSSSPKNVTLFARTKKGVEQLCLKDMKDRFGSSAIDYVVFPAIVIFTIENLSTANLKKISLLKYAIDLCSYIGSVTPESIKEMNADEVKDYLINHPNEMKDNLNLACQTWEFISKCKINETKGFCLRIKKFKGEFEFPLTASASQIEKFLGLGVFKNLSPDMKIDLKTPGLLTRGVASTHIVYGFVLPIEFNRCGATFEDTTAIVVESSADSSSSLPKITQDTNKDVVEKAIMDGVLEKIEGFAEGPVRSRAAELKITEKAFANAYTSFMKWKFNSKAKHRLTAIDDDVLIVDVRSPKEYEQGHIPGAVNMCLFTNDERANVGTCFKRFGKDKAIELGLTYVVPKLDDLVQIYQTLLKKHNKTKILLYCFRGGMRSSSVGWFLDKGNLNIQILNGGYKGFKGWARTIWDEPKCDKVVVVGGRTGTGKTKLLIGLEESGHQVIDLEGLSNHKGSAFGSLPFVLNDIEQPSSEMYLNLLASKWVSLDQSKFIFLEDEGAHIGNVCLPIPFYNNILRRPALVLRLVVPMDVRISILVEDYASKKLISKPEWMAEMKGSITSAQRRLGPQRFKEAIDLIENKDVKGVARLMLTYYDHLYDRHIVTSDGSGSGTGSRDCEIVDVTLEANHFDTLQLVTKVDAMTSSHNFTTKTSKSSSCSKPKFPPKSSNSVNGIEKSFPGGQNDQNNDNNYFHYLMIGTTVAAAVVAIVLVKRLK